MLCIVFNRAAAQMEHLSGLVYLALLHKPRAAMLFGSSLRRERPFQQTGRQVAMN